MRSPWRDALDGKVRVLRALVTEASHDAIGAYYSESPMLRRLVGPDRVEAAAVQMAVEAVDGLERDIKQAEPFFLSHDVLEHVIRQMDTVATPGHPLLERSFRMADLPTRNGLLWFPKPVEIFLRAGSNEVACTARALYFGPAYRAGSIGQDRRLQLRSDPAVLGTVAFLEADRTPFVADLGHRGALLPFVAPFCHEGTTLREHLANQRYADGREADEIDIALNSWQRVFVVALFDLLERKVLLHGGSGLERDARKAAQRAGFSPSVQVVTWAKAEYQYPEGHVPKAVDWRCQWVVREHVRRYKSGKVVTVKAYVKGPDDKPFHAPVDRIHVVRRDP